MIMPVAKTVPTYCFHDFFNIIAAHLNPQFMRIRLAVLTCQVNSVIQMDVLWYRTPMVVRLDHGIVGKG
ncbi:hypothetical protein D3OALGA1CA_5003 [Olavius algarvensis associated proteobacterium Delta 3]|nr:hypothetical protein D3OALGA1CA_5003 [Olavius algarvensis associated proteobacterium Delta 3]